MTFKAEEPLDNYNDKHEIFPMRSPVDMYNPPKLPSLLRKPAGKLAQIAASDGLLESRKQLNKVYADSYFENHYPDADKKLKTLLHEKTMKAWSNMENGIVEKSESKESGSAVTNDTSDRRTISLTINLGK